ncbi:poly-gamma-glutamate hydrolase family protein [Marinobacter sp. DUT-3]|uniref:poly-gamma-glutamate hydrolase family protein n=1 Tax=Marinobacter sp. DUT-3 TaxID=3412036 RepID=UPI003D179C7E
MDRYSSFEVLKAEQTEGRDFRVQVMMREEATVAVIAPHGGAIEPGTSELALAIAGEQLSFAIFEGTKAAQNRDLHITSTNFDEPRCTDVVVRSRIVVAIHGESSLEETVFIGGADALLSSHIGNALEEADFAVREHENPNLQGKSRANICNRGTSGAGVQLELSRGLRSNLFESLRTAGRVRQTQVFHQFVDAVRQGLSHAGLL